jgi:CRP-like cAMP-binding protein
MRASAPDVMAERLCSKTYTYGRACPWSINLCSGNPPRRRLGRTLIPLAYTNDLLERLPPADGARIKRRADRVRLEQQDLYAADARLRHVYFPVRGLISVIAELEDGRGIEVAAVGPEGMAGIALFHGTPVAPYATISQLAGESLVLPADVFLDEVRSCESLRATLSLYSVAYMGQLAQTAACNAAHDMRHRIARLLLICHDAARDDGFGITQEFLARMLGVQRPRVSIIAEALRREGAIAYRRGAVRVLDRRALESASCECYAATRTEFRRLLS